MLTNTNIILLDSQYQSKLGKKDVPGETICGKFHIKP